MTTGLVTTKQAAELTGASIRQLDYWVTHFGLGHGHLDNLGSGTSRGWSYNDVVKARAMALVTRHGHFALLRRIADAEPPWVYAIALKEPGLTIKLDFLEVSEGIHRKWSNLTERQHV